MEKIHGQITANSGYIWNSSIKGGSNVGGIIGNFDYGSISGVYVNTLIEANGTTAGGIVGLLDNSSMTATLNKSNFRNVMVLDSNIKSPTKAGGLIGDIATGIYRDSSLYNNNFIDADVTSENTSTGSLIIGGRADENDYINNTYVYKYSTLNGKYVYASNDNIYDEQYLVRVDLDNQNTYLNRIGLGTAYWNYASLAQGKYPKIKNGYLYKPELQTGVDLPGDPEISEISMLNESDDKKEIIDNELSNNINNEEETLSIKTMPNYKVYPISANEINVDFSGIVNDYNAEIHSKIAKEQQPVQNSENSSSSISFTYCINGQEQETVELSNATNQTYTFKYNFIDTIEIKLTRKNNLALNNKAENKQENLALDEGASSNTETITITPNDVRSEASLVGGNNAYLLGINLYINGELQQGEYVNVYKEHALRSDGTLINIATGEIVGNEEINSRNNVNSSQTYLEQDVRIELKQTPKPLHTYEYKGNNIEVYGTYSKVNGNIKTQIYNVRNGELSALSNSLDMKIGNSITDNYNNKEYQTILNTSGELIDLKEMLKYPDNFLTRNIKQIVQNTDEEKTEVMVLYNTGKAIVFNYVTGEVVYENNEKADEGLTDYIAGSIENIWSDYEEKRQEYAKSKELEQKLAELPVEKALEQVTGIISNKDNQGENSNVSNNNNNQNEKENNLSGNSSNIHISSNTNKNRNATNETITNTETDNSYLTVYNAETGKYEVFSEDEILNESDETPVSETEKITQNGLESVYGYDAKEETKPQTNGAIIVIVIIAVAIIALVVLRRVIVKNNTKKKR